MFIRMLVRGLVGGRSKGSMIVLVRRDPWM